MVIFWTAAAVSVFLLGGGFATLRHVFGGGGVGDYVVLSLSVLGLAASLLVAGRNVLVAARVQRRARDR